MSENVVGPVVVCHLERMRAPYGRGRGLYTLWVELSVMLAYASLTDVDSHTGDCS